MSDDAKDGERLDWLFKHRIYDGSHHDCGVQLCVDNLRLSKKRIRELIDTAMIEEKRKP